MRRCVLQLGDNLNANSASSNSNTNYGGRLKYNYGVADIFKYRQRRFSILPLIVITIRQASNIKHVLLWQKNTY